MAGRLRRGSEPRAERLGDIRRALGGDDKQSHIQTSPAWDTVSARVETLDTAAHDAARTQQRLVVLPLRLLKPDAGNGLFVVQPSRCARGLAVESRVDHRPIRVLCRRVLRNTRSILRKIAEAAQVDLVLSGTLLRVADQVRVSVELADAVAGTDVVAHRAGGARRSVQDAGSPRRAHDQYLGSCGSRCASRHG